MISNYRETEIQKLIALIESIQIDSFIECRQSLQRLNDGSMPFCFDNGNNPGLGFDHYKHAFLLNGIGIWNYKQVKKIQKIIRKTLIKQIDKDEKKYKEITKKIWKLLRRDNDLLIDFIVENLKINRTEFFMDFEELYSLTRVKCLQLKIEQVLPLLYKYLNDPYLYILKAAENAK